MSDEVGDVSAIEPPVPAVVVSAGAQTVLAVADTGELAVSMRDANRRSWTPLELPPVATGVRLLAVAPDGGRVAIVGGEAAGSAFDLTVRDLVTGTARSRPIGRGLNGPPAWLGPSLVIVDAIRQDGSSSLIAIDPATGLVRDDVGPGTILAASADGSKIAVDDPVTGAAFVGSAEGWQASGFDGLFRLDGRAGTSAEALAMSADGHRLAIVRRGESAEAIEILVEADGRWQLVRSIPLPAGVAASIAWTR